MEGAGHKHLRGMAAARLGCALVLGVSAALAVGARARRVRDRGSAYVVFVDCPDPDNFASVIAALRLLQPRAGPLHVVLTGRPTDLGAVSSGAALARAAGEVDVLADGVAVLQDAAARLERAVLVADGFGGSGASVRLYDGGLAPSTPISHAAHARDFLFDRSDLQQLVRRCCAEAKKGGAERGAGVRAAAAAVQRGELDGSRGGRVLDHAKYSWLLQQLDAFDPVCSSSAGAVTAAAAAAAAAATAPDAADAVDSMSLRELKGVLDAHAVDYRTCIEKGDFRALARRCLADAAAATAAAAADRAALLRRVLRRPEAPWAVLRPLSDLARALASDEEGGNDDEELIAIVGGPMTALAKLLGATAGGRGAADDDADRSIAPAQSARVRARLTQVHAMFGAWGVGKASSVNLFPNQFNAAADLDAARALLLPTSPHALRCPVFVVPTEACQRPPNPSPSAAYLREPSATAALLFPGASTTAAARAAGARSEFLALYALWGGCQSKPAHSMCVFDLAPVLSAVPRFRAGFDWAPARFFMSADDSVMQLGLASDDASRSSVARLDLLAARAAQQK